MRSQATHHSTSYATNSVSLHLHAGSFLFVTMPQNRFKQDSKTLAPTKPSTSSNQQGRSTVQQCSITADADSSSWQRGQGGFSGRAKKDYLKWKRQQKAAAVSGDDSDWAPQVDSSKHGSVPVAQPALPDAHTPAYATAGAAATAGPSHAWPMNTKDDPSLPLQYRPLVAVPAAPFTCSSSSSTAGPVGHPTAAADAETAVAELVNMPCLDPAEVGFTAEGFQLDMPTRPHWQVTEYRGIYMNGRPTHSRAYTGSKGTHSDSCLCDTLQPYICNVYLVCYPI